MEERILGDMGLSRREIAVYKALLKSGRTKTGPLVKESGVQNAKIYETLDKLMKKGMISYIVKGKMKYFQASNPNTLLSFYENKRSELEKTVKDLQVLQGKREPELETRVYEGTRAVISVFFEMYDYIGRESEYCAFPIGEQLVKEELVQFWTRVFLKRLRMKIRIRSLPSIRWRGILNKLYKKHLRLIEVRYTEQEFPTGIFIFKDHVLNVIWAETPIAFLIKSGENAQVWQKFFDEQWIRSKPSK